MTNREKFIEIINKTFGAGFTLDNFYKDECMCEGSPCGLFKKGACETYKCDLCIKWWDKEYEQL